MHDAIMIWSSIFLVNVITFSSSTSIESVCTTDACKETAAIILNSMDRSVDPCDDFYEFACGNFVKTATIPPGVDMVSAVAANPEILKKRLEFLFNEPITPEDIRPFVLVKQYYKSCLENNKNETVEIVEYEYEGTHYSSISTNRVDCIKSIIRDLDVATAALYSRRHITNEVKKSSDDLVKHLRNQFINSVEETEWLDSETKGHALEKVHAMKEIVAYPEEFLNDGILEEYYSKLIFNSTNYSDIELDIIEFQRTLVEPLTNTQKVPFRWHHYSKEVLEDNAFYNWLHNYMLISATILTSGMFNADWPPYRNYGGMGMVIGHELMHSVDNTGRLYDKNGDLNDWWTPRSNEIYENKIRCIFQQYADFIDSTTQLHVDASRTLGENIADTAGIHLSYLAYKQATENTSQQLLPGLQQYNTNQLFWISAANTWCQKSTMNFRLYTMTEDTHSLNQFRVNGAYSNSEYFAQDFQCTPTSQMNRPNKCEW